jgi:hypothetical protein
MDFFWIFELIPLTVPAFENASTRWGMVDTSTQA